MHDHFELDPSVTYLNCASMSPMLKSVREASMAALELRANPWRMTKDDWFADSEVLRNDVATVFKTTGDNIAFAPSASYGMALAAKNMNFKAGKTIVVLDKQFPSNVYTWEHLVRQYDLKIVRVRKQDDKSLTESILDAIHDQVVLVAIPNCHWMDGSWIDVEKVSQRVKSVHALLVLDLSQSLGALPIDIEKVDPDFAVAAGYKWMLGPYGLGYMYIAPRWQHVWEPLEYSWLPRYKSEDFSKLTDYTELFKNGARKFDCGEYPMLSIRPMAVAAVKQIVSWGVDSIQSYTKSLTLIVNQYNESNGVATREHVGHIVGIPFGKRDPNAVKKILSAQKLT
ncbi:aminotransferase class V-fold PLP-dependent enzyme [Pseudochryseolinea flava]|uniref:Aminotransferase n=1 Tax=Pseudochryseolinea flava TaxID=2059302 RepID=A0A364Y277_9BACT|nr:aminotransferase class V-fold PLP-dependent enzyme [Pseudochryseolinea flava]RAW00975.1 aminotransferase [Pseudochryseolinea flava]